MSIETFFKTACVSYKGLLTRSGLLYDSYLEWCRRIQETPQIASIKALTQFFKQKGYTMKRTSTGRHIEGIGLHPPILSPPTQVSPVAIVQLKDIEEIEKAEVTEETEETNADKHAKYDKSEAYYQTAMDMLVVQYQDLITKEPPMTSFLEHENWRLEKQKIINHMNILENWFIDLEEPAPIYSSELPDYRSDLRMWFERNSFKLRKHYTVFCPNDVIPLLEKPTSYRTKVQRHTRLLAYQERYERLDAVYNPDN